VKISIHQKRALTLLAPKGRTMADGGVCDSNGKLVGRVPPTTASALYRKGLIVLVKAPTFQSGGYAPWTISREGMEALKAGGALYR